MSEKGSRNLIFPAIMVLLGLALIGGALYILLAGRQPSASAIEPAIADIPSTDSLSNIERINLQDAKTAFDSKSAVFVDVRGEVPYNEGHVPGALSITLNEIPNKLSELKPSQWIIPYCT